MIIINGLIGVLAGLLIGISAIIFINLLINLNKKR